MWDGFVELVRLTIFSAAHLCAGSLGGSVLLVAFALRLALLPLSLRLARQARANQARLSALRPALEALQRRHAAEPARLLSETRALYRRHGIRLVAPGNFLGLLVQLPVLGALFAAVRRGLGAQVRFLWIADLARPDATLVLGVTALSAAVTVATSADPATAGSVAVPRLLPVMVGVGTLAFLWSASSAVALSVGAGSLVTALQNWLLARDGRRAPIAAP
jgi:YidC/Oxa1 family membrane protein insertase